MEQGGASRARPGRIGQIAIPVRDVERATEFYRDVLGLEHLFSAPPGLSFFRCGEVRLMLAQPEPEEGGGEGGGTLLYYSVDDPREAHAGLQAGGAEVVAQPHVVHRSGGDELWIGFYRDSEGTMFGTMAEIPAPGEEG